VNSAGPTVELRNACLDFGERPLWQHLNLAVAQGEFLAVLGPNGSGKTSLIKVLLGLISISSGSARICGESPSRGSSVVGYVPQQKGFDRDLPIRGVDLVRFGLDGHRWGIGLPDAQRRHRVRAAIASMGATSFAQSPIGRLSGGEQQRLRVAQALVGEPQLLLCDEPLLSLDLRHQRQVVDLIDDQRRASNISVLFVTHEINPILPVVERILYLVGSRWAVGTPDQILTTESLSELYQTRVEVLDVGGRIVIVGAPDSAHAEPAGPHHHHLSDDTIGLR